MSKLTESSIGLDSLGSLRRMPYGRDSPFLRMSVPHFCPWASVCGLHGQGPRCDELYLLARDPH